MNRGRRVRARVVWSTIADAARYCVEVGDGPLELPSDTYVCTGAATLGSGRSVFVDGIQVKGVGRTAHAPPPGKALLTDGTLTIDRALREIHGAQVVARWWKTPTIPMAFCAIRGERALLGRRGSPIRIGHLSYLRGGSYSRPHYIRLALWRQFVNRLAGRGGFAADLDVIHGVFDAVVDGALRAVAESRLTGLVFANWHDNADMFARSFDCEDVGYVAGPLPACQVPRRPREDARTYFVRTDWATPDALRTDVYRASLQYVQNAFIALDHLADGLTYDQRAVDRRYAWPRLEAGYRAALETTAKRLRMPCPDLPLIMAKRPTALAFPVPSFTDDRARLVEALGRSGPHQVFSDSLVTT